MAQFFVTTYGHDYRWHETKGMRPPCKASDRYSEGPPPGDIWIEPEILEHGNGEEETEKILAAENKVKKMIRNRLWTIYQVDYCKPDELKPESGRVMTINNVTLIGCRQLFREKTMKIPPPLPTTRRLFGYIRPTRMYIPKTTYEEDFGRVGCGILENNYERIISQGKNERTFVCK